MPTRLNAKVPARLPPQSISVLPSPITRRRSLFPPFLQKGTVSPFSLFSIPSCFFDQIFTRHETWCATSWIVVLLPPLPEREYTAYLAFLLLREGSVTVSPKSWVGIHPTSSLPPPVNSARLFFPPLFSTRPPSFEAPIVTTPVQFDSLKEP